MHIYHARTVTATVKAMSQYPPYFTINLTVEFGSSVPSAAVVPFGNVPLTYTL
jgi:hypothetical protein